MAEPGQQDGCLGQLLRPVVEDVDEVPPQRQRHARTSRRCVEVPVDEAGQDW
jgi:hypothetical protein